MKKIILASLMAITLAGCTTFEKTASGAAAGAAIGGVATKSVGGAVAGAFIGGIGTFLVEVADGFCQYRRSDGRVITRRCHYY